MRSSRNEEFPLRVEVKERGAGTIHRLTVSRPRRLNALDTTAVDALAEALVAVGEDRRARAAIVAGAGGKAWVGGADVHELAALEPVSARRFITRLHGLFSAVRALPVPVLAAIDGYCLGAGLELAASCDVRLATRASQFGMPEVQVGIPSVIEAALLTRLIGAGRARDLVLTGRRMPADEALACGLVDALAGAGGLEELVEQRVALILSAGPKAVRAQKALCRQWEELPLADAVRAGIETFSMAFESGEPKAYLERFINRRRENDASE